MPLAFPSLPTIPPESAPKESVRPLQRILSAPKAGFASRPEATDGQPPRESATRLEMPAIPPLPDGVRLGEGLRKAPVSSGGGSTILPAPDQLSDLSDEVRRLQAQVVELRQALAGEIARTRQGASDRIDEMAGCMLRDLEGLRQECRVQLSQFQNDLFATALNLSQLRSQMAHVWSETCRLSQSAGCAPQGGTSDAGAVAGHIAKEAFGRLVPALEAWLNDRLEAVNAPAPNPACLHPELAGC